MPIHPTHLQETVAFTPMDADGYEYETTRLCLSLLFRPSYAPTHDEPGGSASVELQTVHLRGLGQRMQRLPESDAWFRRAQRWVERNDDWLCERGANQAQGEADDAAEARAEVRRDAA